PWDLAGESAYETHDVVRDVRRRIEHQRAAAIDHVDAPLAAVGGSGFGDAALSNGPMHPDVLDAEVGAFAHRGFSDRRSRPNHDSSNATRDRGQVVIAAIAFELVRVGVDREDLIAPLSQAPIDNVGSMPLRWP